MNEDFAIESMVGDVFLLGHALVADPARHPGEVRVVDAEGAHPTIPFWVGEAPSRTAELSEEVSALRRAVGELLTDSGDAGRSPWPRRGASTCRAGVRARDPTRRSSWSTTWRPASVSSACSRPSDDVVFERFFDEAGGMQMVVHAPFGGRVNRALGLALRKRFCATFDFELQAAANDDAVVLSLGPQHSFPLDSAPRLLRSETAEGVLRQAVLASPMFAARWRWNLNRSLAVLRFRGGKKNPLPIQRMEADDLMAAVFPALAACQENAPGGPIVIPDHVLVRQTLYDCLHEAMDVDGLRRPARPHGVGRGARALRRLDRAVGAVPRDPQRQALHVPRRRPARGAPHPRRAAATGPSPPRRGARPARRRPRSTGCADEAAPDVRGPEELHDLLLSTVVWRPERRLRTSGSAHLADAGGPAPGHGHGASRRTRATRPSSCGARRSAGRWVEALFPGVVLPPRPASATRRPGDAAMPDADEVAAEAVRGHLEVPGR